MLPSFLRRLARPRRSAKPRAMSGRRLPLFSAAERAVAPVSAPRQALPGRSVIIADTGTDLAALDWAVRLVDELGGLGRRVPVVLSAPGAAERFERLAGASSVRNVDAAPLASLAGDDLWVLVGQPALIAAHGWLSVLLAADAPLVRWPAPLRALRGELALELSGAPLDVASALARELARLSVRPARTR
jgi:hypothetical protein